MSSERYEQANLEKNYYEILGVEQSATSKEIKNAYRKLARQFHPDKNKEAGAAEEFKKIGEAYETLIDPEKRASYNSHNFIFSKPANTTASFNDLENLQKVIKAQDEKTFFNALNNLLRDKIYRISEKEILLTMQYFPGNLTAVEYIIEATLKSGANVSVLENSALSLLDNQANWSTEHRDNYCQLFVSVIQKHDEKISPKALKEIILRGNKTFCLGFLNLYVTTRKDNFRLDDNIILAAMQAFPGDLETIKHAINAVKSTGGKITKKVALALLNQENTWSVEHGDSYCKDEVIFTNILTKTGQDLVRILEKSIETANETYFLATLKAMKQSKYKFLPESQLLVNTLKNFPGYNTPKLVAALIHSKVKIDTYNPKFTETLTLAFNHKHAAKQLLTVILKGVRARHVSIPEHTFKNVFQQVKDKNLKQHAVDVYVTAGGFIPPKLLKTHGLTEPKVKEQLSQQQTTERPRLTFAMRR